MKKICCTALFIAVFMLTAGIIFAGGGNEKPPEEADTEIKAGGLDNPIIVSETNDTVTILDFDGNNVVLSKKPKRVIIHYTSMLGLWYLAGGTAIARPDTKSGRGVPEAAMDIETTGHVNSPNTEKIISLEPDLVVLSGSNDSHRNLKMILDQSGINNVMLGYDNYSDFVNVLDLFACIVGNEEVVENVVPKILREVQNEIDAHLNKPGPKFISLFASARDVSAELNVAHTAHIAAMLGGENISEEDAPKRGQKRITLSMERIIERNPEVILITVMGDLEKVQDKMREDLESNQAWASLEAVQKGRVYYLPGEYFLYKPNEKFPEAFRYLAEVLYQ